DAAITRLVDVEAELLQVLSRPDRDRMAALLRKLSLSYDSRWLISNGRSLMAMRSPRPIRDGVGATRLHVPRTGPWPTISEYMVERFFHLDSEWLRERFDRGEIVAFDGSAVRRDAPLNAEEFVWYYREPPEEIESPFYSEVLHQDMDLVVIDKPPCLPTTPAGKYVQNSALVRLRRQLDNADLAPIPRLDRATAGVLMFS